MKKIKNSISLFLCFALLFSFLPHSVSATESNLVPFEPYSNYTSLYTADDLLKIMENPEGNYCLENDIHIPDSYYMEGGIFYNEGKGWAPLGSYTEPFKGVLDGKYYTISNLRANYTGILQDASLFSRNNGIIRRLSVNIEYDICYEVSNNSVELAPFCNLNDGIIEDCQGNGTINLTRSSNILERYHLYIYAGGICISNNKTITRCSSNVICNFEGDTPTSSQATYFSYGGITQETGGYYAYIADCYSTGYCKLVKNNSDGTSETVALNGIAEKNSNGGVITRCYSSGYVPGVTNNLLNSSNYDFNVTNCIVPENANSSYLTDGTHIKSVSSSDMLLKSTYTGWDFENTWSIEEGISTPVLKKNMRNLSPEYYYFEHGNGTEEHPYIITKGEQFLAVYEMRDSYYELGSDISLKGIDIFHNQKYGGFKGVFDGNGYAIKDCVFKDVHYIFSGNSGTIKNLKITDVSFNHKILGYQSYCSFSVLTGQNSGTISNCYISGEYIISKPKQATKFGAFSPTNGGTITNCYTDITVIVDTDTYISGDVYVGGFSGENDGTITNCDFYGKIIASAGGDIYIGGICGKNYIGYGGTNKGNITNCSSSGDIAYIENYNNNINSRDINLGGIIGINQGENVNNNLFIGTITYSNIINHPSVYVFIGGIAAINDSYGKIANCYNAGACDIYVVDTNYYHIGGIVGQNKGSASGYAVSSFPSVTNYTYYSGIAGTVLTAKEMTVKSSFTDFDFENVWTIEDNGFFFPQFKNRTINYDLKPIAIDYKKFPKLTSYFESEDFDFSDMEINRIMNNGAVEKTDLWDVYLTDADGYLYYGENLFAVVYEDDEYMYSLPLTVTILETMKIGDLNADESVNALDLTELRKYLLDSNYKTHTVTADMNNDGEIDVRDLVNLKRTLS